VQVIDRRTTLALLRDIDDTVMVTAVPRLLLAIWNSFIRHSTARRAVPAMASMYRELVGTQQVLSHGTTASAADNQRSTPVSGVTEVYGGDGEALAKVLLASSASHRPKPQTE